MTGRALVGIAAGIVVILLGCAGALSAVLYGGGDATTIGCTTRPRPVRQPRQQARQPRAPR